MKRLIICGALALVACKKDGGAGTEAPSGPLTFRSDDERTLYALGLVMGDRMGEFNLTPAELQIVQRGIADKVLRQRPQVELRTFGPRIGQLASTRGAARAEQERTRGTQFLAAAAREQGAVRLPSGLVYRELRAGTGAQPTASDRVRVHYTGTLTDGTEFDTSRGGEPVEFPLGGVIPCWTEGVARMRVGGRAKLVCPSDLAYGDRGQRGIPAGATLVFEVELVGIAERPDAGSPLATTPGAGDAGAR